MKQNKVRSLKFAYVQHSLKVGQGQQKTNGTAEAMSYLCVDLDLFCNETTHKHMTLSVQLDFVNC